MALHPVIPAWGKGYAFLGDTSESGEVSARCPLNPFHLIQFSMFDWRAWQLGAEL